MRGHVRTLLLLLAAPLVLSTAAAGAFAQGGTDLNGTVVARDGRPKQFASVQLEGPRRYAAMTDANGRFTITGFTAGRYTVRIRQGDYVETQTHEIGAGPLKLTVK